MEQERKIRQNRKREGARIKSDRKDNSGEKRKEKRGIEREREREKERERKRARARGSE